MVRERLNWCLRDTVSSPGWTVYGPGRSTLPLMNAPELLQPLRKRRRDGQEGPAAGTFLRYGYSLGTV